VVSHWEPSLPRSLDSPETAERIAVLEAATNGKMSALQAARLNVGRAGGDMGMLDGLHAQQTGHIAAPQGEAARKREAVNAVEVATSSGPFVLSTNQRNETSHHTSQNGSWSRS
jgi:hypothetical protein